MTREHALRIGVCGSSRGSDSRPSERVGKFRGGIGRGPDTFVLLEIQTVSGSRDSIRVTSMTAMSGQFDFRSAWENSDAIGSKASYYEGTETERIMYIIYIDTKVISFYCLSPVES